MRASRGNSILFIVLSYLSFAFAQLLCSSGVSGVSGVSDISSGIASFQEWKEWKTLVLKDSLFYGIYRV
jgi:hypothetical protein